MKKNLEIYLILILLITLFVKKMKKNIFIRPLKTTWKISKNGGYGWREEHPITKERSFHNGIDIGAPAGTPVFTPADSVVLSVYYNDIGGNQVRLSHYGGRFVTGYAHLLTKPNLKTGQKIKQGKEFAQVGSTGRSTGAHLHLTLRKNNKLINPEEYF